MVLCSFVTIEIEMKRKCFNDILYGLLFIVVGQKFRGKPGKKGLLKNICMVVVDIQIRYVLTLNM